MKALVLLLVFAAHSPEGVKENNIALSELFLFFPPEGELRLVFYHPCEGMTNEKEVLNFVLTNRRFVKASKAQVQLFFDMYDKKTIEKHAKSFSRREWRDGYVVEVMPRWVVVLYKPP